MSENWFWFILLGLASFRLTRLIVFDKICEFLRKPFLEELEEENEQGELEQYIGIKGEGLRAWIGELLSCYWCTGVWTSLFLFLLFFYSPLIGKGFIAVFAVAGFAGIIETFVRKNLE